MVPEAGIEPARPFSGKRRILSPLCLPISPLGLRVRFVLRDDRRGPLTKKARMRAFLFPLNSGGGGRDRTGVNGFAGRCITTLLPRHGMRIVTVKT
jgi:hypothetical protein